MEQLQKQLDEVQQQLDEAQQSAEDQNSGVDMYDKLLDAQSLSEEGKNVEARAVLSEINATVLSDKGKALYNSISATVDTEAFKELYASGQSSYDSGDYAAAVDSRNRSLMWTTPMTMAAPCICMPVHCTEAATQTRRPRCTRRSSTITAARRTPLIPSGIWRRSRRS